MRIHPPQNAKLQDLTPMNTTPEGKTGEKPGLSPFRGKTGATPFFPEGKMGSCTGFSGPQAGSK